MRGARAALGIAGLLLVCAAAYAGARIGLDAIGTGAPSPGASRPGIEGIVVSPSPRAPLRVSSSLPSSRQDVGSEESADPPADTVSSELTGGYAQGVPSEGEAAGVAASGSEGSEGSDPSSSQSAPQPPPGSAEKEDPPITRYPGK